MEYVAGARAEGCVFCERAHEDSGDAEPVLYRGEFNFALLNAYPYNSGHLMIVPYQHTGELDDLDEATLCEMMSLAQAAIRAMRRCMRPDGINLGMNMGKAAGAGIDEHVHLHVVPRWSGDTNFMTSLSDTRVVPESLDECARRLGPMMAEEAGGEGDR